MGKWMIGLLLAGLVVMSTLGMISGPGPDPEAPAVVVEIFDPVTRWAPQGSITSMPEPFFTENLGQLDAGGIRYYSHGDGVSIGFGIGEVLYSKRDPGGETAFRVEFEGCEPVEPEGVDPLGHPTSFLKGPERDWIAGARSFGKVTYSGLWEGVDIVYYFQDTDLKYDVMLDPGVDPTVIRFRYVGVEGLELDPVTGALVVRTPAGELREDAPVAFDERIGGRSEVDCRFDIVDVRTLGFVLEGHDPGLPLVIDPGLAWGTYLGSPNSDYQKHMAVDGRGYMYLVGYTWGNAFPTRPGSYDTSHNGVQDGFIVKLSRDGRSLEYATYLGSTSADSVEAIRVDDSGYAYLTGWTSGSGFPSTTGAYDTSAYNMDAFVTKLNASGTGLEFSTFLGGSKGEKGMAIDIDASGNVFIQGETSSTDLPVTSDAVDRYFNRGDTDAFMAKLNASGSDLLYCTYLGGGDTEYARDIHADGDSVFLLGFTGSDDFPTTSGAFDTSFRSKVDIYVTKVNVSAGALVYSTYVGSGGIDNGVDLFVDRTGCAYVTGSTDSGTFPTKNPYQVFKGGWNDAIAFKLNPSGSDLVFSTFIGESDDELGYGIAVDAQGVVHLAGLTNDDGFPTTEHAFSSIHGGLSEAFYMRLSANGTQLLYSTFIGGTSTEFIAHLQLDNMGYAYASGSVQGNGFPITPGAFDTSFNGNNDAFAIKFDVQPPAMSDPEWASNGTTGDPFNISVRATDNGEIEMVQVEYWHGTDGARILQNLTLATGTRIDGTWTGAINASPNTLETLNFEIHAWDGMGNLAPPLTGNATIIDDDLPELFDLTPFTEGTGNPLTFRVFVEDNLGVSMVGVETWPEDRYDLAEDFEMVPLSTTGDGNGTYLYTITLPTNTTIPVHYRLYANDTSDNWNLTDELTVMVVDDDPPSFGEDASPNTADTDHLYAFSILVADNIEVADVWVLYRYGEGEMTRLNLTSTNGTPWEGTMIVADTLDDLHFVFGCNDTSGNVNSTQERTIDVIDVNGPQMINVGTRNWATTGDPHEFTFTAHDNVGLWRAMLWYAFDDGELTPVSMEVVEAYPSSGNVLYSIFIDVPSDQSENITYSYEVEDLYGNVLRTHVDIIRVRDDDDPWIVEDRTPLGAGMGEDLTFEVVVSDNIGIGTVEVEYSLAEGDPVTAQMAPGGAEGVHTLTIEVAVDEPGPISYRFRVVDLAWNEVNGTHRLVAVADVIPPEILDVTWGEAIKGTDVTVVLVARDNVGVEQASLSYRFWDGAETSVEMDGELEAVIHIPRNAVGELRLVLTVRDAAVNEAVSEVILVPLLNTAPTVDPIPLWEVIEEEDSYLDLAPFISDANDDLSSLTLSTGDGEVTVDGLVLRTLFVFPFPDRTIYLNVSDGEDETEFQVTVHIVDVNDAPVIISLSPEDGGRYKEGKVVTMSVRVDDEDGDDLTVTWTSDDVVIGTGETLDYKKLKPGIHTIRVTVSDGELSDEEGFNVTITREEESPTLGGVFVLFAMLVVVAAVVMKEKGKKKLRVEDE